MSGPGRPTLDPKKRKRRKLVALVNDVEFAAVVAAAGGRGNVSAWARKKLLIAAEVAEELGA